MLPWEVREDICWPLARRDLEALLLTDDAWSCVVTDHFACSGPLRAILHVALNDDGLKCQSGDEEKVIENPEDYGNGLRNTVVSMLSIDCKKDLSATAIESLKAVKGKYLLESLRLSGTRAGAGLTLLENDVFTCKDLSYAFDYPEEENNEEKSSEGDPENSDVAKSNSTPEDVMAEFFHTNTVKQASWLALSEMPSCDAELIAEWLHCENGQYRIMHIWWEFGGEVELDALKLVEILKERFVKARSPQYYQFYAGSELFDSYDIRNEYLENPCGECLQIEATRTCYSDVRVTRAFKEGCSTVPESGQTSDSKASLRVAS